MNWKEQVDLNIRLAHAPVHEMRLNDSRDYIRKLFLDNFSIWNWNKTGPVGFLLGVNQFNRIYSFSII
jgi:hypothetical protein